MGPMNKRRNSRNLLDFEQIPAAFVIEGKRAETDWIRTLPPALGTSLRQLSPLPEGGFESGSALFGIVNLFDNGYFLVS